MSVYLSVRPIIRPPHAAVAGLLLSAVPARDIDRQPRPPDAQQHGAQQQIALSGKCRVVLTADITQTC